MTDGTTIAAEQRSEGCRIKISLDLRLQAPDNDKECRFQAVLP
jgi:hypothetical protein